MSDDKLEIRNETETLQEVDAPGISGSKKVKPGETIEVTALIATSFYDCEGWVLLKNGKEIGPEIDAEERTEEAEYKPRAIPKPPARKPPKPPADPPPADEE